MVDIVSQDDPVTRRARGRVGSVLRDKWRIDALIGVGGMAAVYAGTHRNGKRGAIKILHLELSVDPDARSRFLREGYAANRVEHRGAVSVLDDDLAEDGSVFLVMELLEGRTMSDVAEDRPGQRLGLAAVVSIADQLLDVLVAAHDKGIVHRDLKPENLFLTREGTVKVLDFGLASIRDGSSGARATRTGNAMGTPAFMPPEQATGKWNDVDARTDLWAAGATMFTLLTGRLVHQAETVNLLLVAAMTKPAPPLRSILPEVSAPIAAVIDRALSFDREKRWPNARAMQHALREAGRGLTSVPLESLAAPASPVQAVSSLSVEPPNASLLGTTLIHAASRRTASARAFIALGALGLAVASVAVVVLLRPWSRPAAPAEGPAVTATLPPTSPAPLSAQGAASAMAVASADEPRPTSPTVAAAPSSRPTAPPPKGSARAQASASGKPAPAPAKSHDPFGRWE